MKKNDNIFSRHTCKHCSLLFAFCAMFALCTTSDGAVVSRRQRPTTTARMPTMSAMINTTASNTSATTPETESSDVESETEIVIEPEPEIIIEDKTSQFDEFMADSTPTTDTSSESLAAQIRAQRAALDAADAASAAANQMATARASGQNACDANLRECMKQKCGNDYSKCAGDTDTMWGTKMDACRRDLPCSGHEYALFSAQIKADRDMNARIASYNSIVDCGNRYNNCIVTECGQKFTKCLGKRAGDAAISKCEKIAKTCTQQDSGLASRTLNVFGTLRVDAEKQVAADEKRLYELRDKMRDTCGRLGAMFDERTLDCVYTVNFFAGEDNTLYASKKAYAGSTFSCDQNWFGVDITTFKENAFRLTRTQTSATSALMGSGIGMATGAITSGAIDRAIDRHKAEKALKDAESEHDELYDNGESDKKSKETKKESGDATQPIKKQNAEPVISDETRKRIDAERTAKPTVKPMEITKPTATATSEKKNEEITDTPCAKNILAMTDYERELCKSHMERQYPILDDAKCLYSGTNYACRASSDLIEKIDEFRELCDEYNGDYTADITQGTITQDVPWPWNNGYYGSVWRCENLTDEDFAKFTDNYEDITDYLFTSTDKAAELGYDADNSVTMSDWDNNVIIDMGQKL